MEIDVTVEKVLIGVTVLFLCLSAAAIGVCMCQRYHLCCFRQRHKKVYHSARTRGRIVLTRQVTHQVEDTNPMETHSEQYPDEERYVYVRQLELSNERVMTPSQQPPITSLVCVKLPGVLRERITVQPISPLFSELAL